MGPARKKGRRKGGRPWVSLENRACVPARSAKITSGYWEITRCDGQAADAVSAFTKVKMEDAPRLLKIPNSECQNVWIPRSQK